MGHTVNTKKLKQQLVCICSSASINSDCFICFFMRKCQWVQSSFVVLRDMLMNRFVISMSLNAAEAIFVPLPVFTCYIILDEFWTSFQVSVNPCSR